MTLIRFMCWTGIWLISIAIAAFGPKLVWDFDTRLTIIAVVVTLATGVGMILALVQHLKGMDEMQQKVFLEASAISLGIGLVCGNTYELLEDVKLITFQPEISHLIILMAVAFIIGTIRGNRRYR